MFILPRNKPRDDALAHLIRAIHDLPKDRLYVVEIAEKKGTRSLAQNAYLWGCVYPTILKEGGETLGGWSADDLHEYFLGEHFGWEKLEGFGRQRLRPLRRSSRLNKTEFMDYIEFIQRRVAGLGIYVPDPNEELAA